MALRATTQTTTTMGYIPQQALENLKKYSYKGVDKCVIAASPPPRPQTHPRQVARLAICPPAVLGLARYPLANVGRPEHRTPVL